MARFMHGGVVGGKLQPSLVYAGQSIAGAAIGAPATITISGLDFGSAVSGVNQKWALLSLIAWADNTVNFTSISFGGVTGSVIFQTTQAANASTGFGTGTLALATAQIDAVTSGNVSWTDDTASAVWATVAYGVNIDMSAVVDSAKGSGASNVTLAVDCPAKGAIHGHSYFVYSAGGPSAWGHNNLTTHQKTNFLANIGHASAGSVFASAQTNLDVSTAYTPAGARPSGFAVSFAGV